MDKTELKKRLDEHRLWWQTQAKEGRTFTLPNADLSNPDWRDLFENAELSGANLTQCNMAGCNLKNANLESINISRTDLRGANLRFANLKNCDFKFVKIDATTNFEGTQTEGMIVDFETEKALPAFIDRSKLQVIEPLHLNFVFDVPTGLQSTASGFCNQFIDVLKTKYPEIEWETSIKTDVDHRLRFTIFARSRDEKLIAERESSAFDAFLKTGDVEHLRLETDFEKHVFKSQYKLKMLEIEFLKDQIGYLNKRQIGGGGQFLEAPEKAFFENLSEQFSKQNRLPTAREVAALPPAKAIFSFRDQSKKEIFVEAERIVFVEKTDSGNKIWLDNSFDAVVVPNKNRPFANFAADLIAKNADLLLCNKGTILNTSKVKTVKKDHNNCKVTLQFFEKETIVVGQNHIKKFREMVGRHGLEF